MDVVNTIVPISVAIGLTLIHFIGEKISERMRKWHFHLESLGAGLMVGILFLELLPQIFVGQETALGLYIYIPLLAGFTIIALIEKIIYKRILKDNPTTSIKLHAQDEHDKQKQTLDSVVEYKKNLAEIDCIVPEHNAVFEAIALVTHSMMIGILIALVFYENNLEVAFIIMIPFAIRAFTIAFSAEQIIGDLKEKPERVFRIISFVDLTLGALIGVFLVFNEVVFFIVFAFALGLVLFTVIRDMIPLGKKGKPMFFLIGVIFAIDIFLITELVLH